MSGNADAVKAIELGTVKARVYKGETAWYALLQEGERWREYKFQQEPKEEDLSDVVKQFVEPEAAPTPTVRLIGEDGRAF